LDNTTSYSDIRTNMIVAAKTLFGNTSSVVESLTNAWFNVGVGSIYIPPYSPNLSIIGSHSVSYLGNEKYTVPAGLNVDWYFKHEDDGIYTMICSCPSLTLVSIKAGAITKTNKYYLQARDGGNVSAPFDVIANGKAELFPACVCFVKEGNNPTSCNFSISVYPNPVNNTLYIKMEQEYIQVKPLEQPLTDNKPLKINPTYDIRLYNEKGILMWQKKTKNNKIELNVTNLPNGIYYLQVYDGVNETPEMRTIVIEH